MNVFWTRCSTAIAQLLSGDPQLWGIVGVSLSVSASALLIALLPEDQLHFIELNAELSLSWPPITKVCEPLPDAEEWKDVQDKLQHLER